MSAHTDIEWCDSTINPTSGCDGCEILETCYARLIHENRLAHSFPANYAADFREFRMIAGRMRQAARWRDLRGTERADKPWLNGLPRLVFISDMSDALSRAVTFEFLFEEVIKTVREWPHIGLWLTKRPERMADFARWMMARGERWPVNLWPGASITSQRKVRRIDELLRVPAALHFLSVEPMLGPVDLGLVELLNDAIHSERMVRWVIVGGESGPGARPMHPEWARSIQRECAEAGVAFFFKQWGQWGVTGQSQGWRDVPEDRFRIVELSGRVVMESPMGAGGEFVFPLGKGRAGADLDGREWRQMPKV